MKKKKVTLTKTEVEYLLSLQDQKLGLRICIGENTRDFIDLWKRLEKKYRLGKKQKHAVVAATGELKVIREKYE